MELNKANLVCPNYHQHIQLVQQINSNRQIFKVAHILKSHISQSHNCELRGLFPADKPLKKSSILRHWTSIQKLIGGDISQLFQHKISEKMEKEKLPLDGRIIQMCFELLRERQVGCFFLHKLTLGEIDCTNTLRILGEVSSALNSSDSSCCIVVELKQSPFCKKVVDQKQVCQIEEFIKNQIERRIRPNKLVIQMEIKDIDCDEQENVVLAFYIKKTDREINKRCKDVYAVLQFEQGSSYRVFHLDKGIPTLVRCMNIYKYLQVRAMKHFEAGTQRMIGDYKQEWSALDENLIHKKAFLILSQNYEIKEIQRKILKQIESKFQGLWKIEAKKGLCGVAVMVQNNKTPGKLNFMCQIIVDKNKEKVYFMNHISKMIEIKNPKQIDLDLIKFLVNYYQIINSKTLLYMETVDQQKFGNTPIRKTRLTFSQKSISLFVMKQFFLYKKKIPTSFKADETFWSFFTFYSFDELKKKKWYQKQKIADYTTKIFITSEPVSEMQKKLQEYAKSQNLIKTIVFQNEPKCIGILTYKGKVQEFQKSRAQIHKETKNSFINKIQVQFSNKVTNKICYGYQINIGDSPQNISFQVGQEQNNIQLTNLKQTENDQKTNPQLVEQRRIKIISLICQQQLISNKKIKYEQKLLHANGALIFEFEELVDSLDIYYRLIKGLGTINPLHYSFTN